MEGVNIKLRVGLNVLKWFLVVKVIFNWFLSKLSRWATKTKKSMRKSHSMIKVNQLKWLHVQGNVSGQFALACSLHLTGWKVAGVFQANQIMWKRQSRLEQPQTKFRIQYIFLRQSCYASFSTKMKKVLFLGFVRSISNEKNSIQWTVDEEILFV